MDKVKRLRALIEADPGNPFAWYTLAMELKKTDTPGALEVFERLRTEHPRYVATYYHFAKTLEDAGDAGRARQIYAEGIRVAREAGDAHAAAELEAAADLLG